MAKKKQPDFQPTKLRVGKTLPKGRNVTNTSFKSKKIITKDQKFKTSSEDTSLSELLNLALHKNVPIKIDALKKMGRYIDRNIDELSSSFSEILRKVGKILLEDNARVRQEAIGLLTECFDSLSESQMCCFVGDVTSHLDCMMTHVEISIRKDSLDLLSAMLSSHPSLICHSTKLLNNLLNMISSVKPKKGDVSRKRKLDDNINSNITSVEWRDQVLKLIADFLENLVDSFAKQKQKSEDEQKVYWDGKYPLYVPLYAGSGLTPAKLEVYSPGQLKSESQITKELRSFFGDLVNVSSDIVTEEISSLEVLSGCNILKSDSIEHLNTVTQVMCCFGDWYKLGSKIDVEEDPEFLPLVKKIVCEKLMKGFYYSLQDSALKKAGRKSKEEACMHLNLGISYLYSMFILGTEHSNPSMEKHVLICLFDSLSQVSRFNIKSLSMVLQITENFLQYISMFDGEERNPHRNEISEILRTLCGILESSRDREVTKELHSFFMKIALDYNYKFLLEYEGMKKWMKNLFSELTRMKKDKKADKKLLKCINQICSREYPAFISILNSVKPLEVLDLLLLEDEDFQFTVINLITHMTGLPQDFLQDISDLILCDEHLSPKIVVKLIRLLNHRFLDSRVNMQEYFEFVKFLLNVAIDVVSIEKAEEEKNVLGRQVIENSRVMNEAEMRSQVEQTANEQTKLVKPLKNTFTEKEALKIFLMEIQSKCVFCVTPPFSQWERHEEIFEVCLECLLLCPTQNCLIEYMENFFAELSSSRQILPVNSAVALLKLFKKLNEINVYMYEDYMQHDQKSQHVDIFFEEVVLSSMYYISVVTNRLPKEKLKCCGIPELQNELSLNREKAIKVMQLFADKMYDHGTNAEITFHTLRIIQFFIARKYVDANDICEYQPLLEGIHNFCPDNSKQQAALFEIYQYIHSR